MVDVFHGMFATNTASGAQVITGVGFSGKVFLFYSVQQTNKDGSYSGHFRTCFGMADGVTKASRAISSNSSDIVTNSDTGCYHSTSGCVLFATASGTVGAQANISGVNGDGFTLNWLNQISGFAVSGWVGFDVFGGDDVVNHKIISMGAQTATGPQTVSGVGFSGTLAIAIGTNWNLIGGTLDSAEFGAFFSLGMATSNSDQFMISELSEDGQANADTWRWHRTDRFLGGLSAAGALNAEVSFTNFHSDGITLDWIDGSSDSIASISLLVMKISGNNKVVSWNTIAGTGNQDITGVGFSGKYIMLVSTDTASNNSATILSNNRLSIGSARDSTHEGAVWAGDQDAVGTMVNTRGTRDTACFLAAMENTTDSSTSGTMIADFTSFNSDGYSVNKSVNAFNGDTSGMTISSLVIGDTISGAAPEIAPQDITRRAFGGGHLSPSILTPPTQFSFQNAETDNRPIFGQPKIPNMIDVNVSGQLLYY